MHLEYALRVAISDLVKRLKGRTSRKLQDEYPELKKRYWDNHFWQSAMARGQPEISRMSKCKNTWNTTNNQTKIMT